jgi:hypothetical protein
MKLHCPELMVGYREYEYFYVPKEPQIEFEPLDFVGVWCQPWLLEFWWRCSFELGRGFERRRWPFRDVQRIANAVTSRWIWQRSQPMKSEAEKGNLVARAVWAWLVEEEAVELVPWAAGRDTPQVAEERGRRRALAGLREVILKTVNEIREGEEVGVAVPGPIAASVHPS